MELPRVSIIIPTYNRAKYLPNAIESALMQKYKNLEIVVSDNCSIDETPKVMERYVRYKNVLYFRNNTNIGMVANWRKALYYYCTGDWAIILSDDDYLIYDKYIHDAMNLVAYYSNRGNIGLVSANIIVHDYTKNIAYKTKHRLDEFVNGKWAFLNYRNGFFFPLCSTLFNTSLMKAINAFKFNNVIASDMLEFLRLLLRGNALFIDKAVAIYRFGHKQSCNVTLNADIYSLVQNINAVIVPYKEAKQLNVFDIHEIDSWKEKQISITMDSILSTLSLSNRKLSSIFTTYKLIRNEFPGIEDKYLLALLKPKNILKLALPSKIYIKVWKLYKGRIKNEYIESIF